MTEETVKVLYNVSYGGFALSDEVATVVIFCLYRL